ncbi:Aminoglycoside 6-adenylyltransferase [Paracoccus haematequi]|uniref:Aminoglycoside 6-adenylyltransferase n=1 Tax=Paracoccus haematequi TaxID=2491866 RepID=A0A3S4CIR5_9RHOB|nr:aminoglycoside 6-adenylyltransferase [Paracoccus haematequi]VDS08534.1 Aminoglycoside 6-adenylyltransferase [Paracoccus haematequi]
MDYDSVLRDIINWARSDRNIRCVVLTGSAAAASDHPLSDRDIEIHLRDPKALERDDYWWNALGTVLAVEKLEDADGQPTRLIYYSGGKLDFTLVDVTVASGVYDRPFRVLLDKDGAAQKFRRSKPPAALPDQETYDECVNWASAAALMTAKAIVRNEPWSVKIRDSDLKSELLRMIEWDHLLRYGGSRDVRYLGTRMRQWMDTETQKRLEGCWATFSLIDSERALIASHQLFHELAAKVAIARGLIGFDHEAVRAEMSDILTTAGQFDE